MKKAIIDPRQSVSYVSGYRPNGDPIFTIIPNSSRVCEVVSQEFPIAEPLFWVDCPDDAVADLWYYDTIKSECFPVPLAPQPVVSGAQTL